MAKVSFLDLLANASADDLAQVDAKIVSKQAELDKATATIAAYLAALKVIRKVLDLKLNGKPPRKVRQSKAAKGAAPVGDAVSKIEAVLRDNGPCKTMTIARKLGGEHLEHSVRITIGKNKSRFLQNDDGTWELVS